MNDLQSGWETRVYGLGRQMNRHTWGEVYYFTHRYFPAAVSSPAGRNVLELGSGAGNNLVFFADLGMNVYGVEYSRTACEEARRRLAAYPQITSEVRCGDFCEQLTGYPAEFFDLIVDRGALTHNTTAGLKRVLTECFRVMKTGGKIFSIHFFSDHDPRCGRGERVDANTYRAIDDETFADVPMVHFSNVDEISELYRNFTIEFLQEETTRRYLPHASGSDVSFNLVARKH